jgi:septum site-determining protein MinD
MAMHFADEALVVTNPEVSSVRDSDRILGMLGSKTKRAIEGGEPIKEHLLITRYNPSRVQDGQMLSLEDIQDILRIKLIGVIPKRSGAAGVQPGRARHPRCRAAMCPRPTRT